MQNQNESHPFSRELYQVQERQLKMQSLLLGIASRYINIKLDKVNEAINESLSEIGRFINADRSYIFEYNPEKKIARNTFEWCAEGVEPQIQFLQELPLEHIDLWYQTHKQNQPFYVEDVGKLPLDGPGGLRDILEPQGIKSLITIPMLDEDRLLGAVGFDMVRKNHTFSTEEKTILRLFSDILVNIQLRGESESARKSYFTIKENQNEQLRNFAYIISHKIRSHSSNIDGLLKLLLLDNPELKNQETTNMLLKASTNLEHTLRDLNKLVTLHNPVQIKEKIELIIEIKKGIQSLSIDINQSGIVIAYDMIKQAHIEGIMSYVQSVIVNLASNAIRFRSKDRPGRLLISVKELDELIEMTFEDNGQGIDLDKYGKDIFGLFNTFHKQTESRGMGLYIAKNQLMVMGATIQISSVPDHGTTLIVKFRKFKNH